MNIEELKDRFKKESMVEDSYELNKLIMNTIKEQKFIIYGGLAIDYLVRYASNDMEFYYPKNTKKDFDVIGNEIEMKGDTEYIKGPFIDTINLAKNIAKLGIKYIKIVTGLTGKTRKIFINCEPEAIIDISPRPTDGLETIQIGDMFIMDPQFLKVDQYQNLCFNLYNDYYRMEKAKKKLTLLEKHYPIDTVKFLLYKKEYVYDYGMNKDIVIDNDETVYGGDFVYYLYYKSDNKELRETILYNNDMMTEIGKKELLYFPNYRILPMNGATWYKEYNYKDKIIKICPKITLLYQYYDLLIKKRDHKCIKKIKTLLADSETMNLEGLMIHVPKNDMIKEYTVSMPTTWILEGKILNE